jgi:hypothetical protein
MANAWGRLAQREQNIEAAPIDESPPDQEAEARFRAALDARRRAGPGQPQLVEEPELPIGVARPRLTASDERLRLRAEQLAAQGRTDDAATLRFMVGRPLPRPLPRYLLDLLDQELIDLLDRELELPMPQARSRQAK